MTLHSPVSVGAGGAAEGSAEKVLPGKDRMQSGRGCRGGVGRERGKGGGGEERGMGEEVERQTEGKGKGGRGRGGKMEEEGRVGRKETHREENQEVGCQFGCPGVKVKLCPTLNFGDWSWPGWAGGG